MIDGKRARHIRQIYLLNQLASLRTRFTRIASITKIHPNDKTKMLAHLLSGAPINSPVGCSSCQSPPPLCLQFTFYSGFYSLCVTKPKKIDLIFQSILVVCMFWDLETPSPGLGKIFWSPM